MKNLYVYIGRFQIPHIGHESVMKYSIVNGDKVVILIGSANAQRSQKNPFTYNERSEMIERISSDIKKNTDKNTDVEILPLNDFDTDEEWVEAVKSSISEGYQVYLTGCRKTGDDSTFYLNLFPTWKQDFIQEVENKEIGVISSTQLRKDFFEGREIKGIISNTTRRFLSDFKSLKKEVFKDLKKQ